MRYFNLFQLTAIANKAKEVCGLVEAQYDSLNGCDNHRGWKPCGCDEEEGAENRQTRFDYALSRGNNFDFSEMTKWQSVCEWAEKMIGEPLVLHIGYRGNCIEDIKTCICISFKENIEEFSVMRKKIS